MSDGDLILCGEGGNKYACQIDRNSSSPINRREEIDDNDDERISQNNL